MMRLTILLASAALAMPAAASATGYPAPQNVNHGCGAGYGGQSCGKARGVPVGKLPHINFGNKPGHAGKPPKLPYHPVPPTWQPPHKGTPVGHLPNVNFGQNTNTNSNANNNQNSNSNRNENQNVNSNSNRNRNSARAGARAAALAGATAGASATGGNASIGNVSTGPSTATASNSNTNNANNSSNLSSNVRVEGDTYTQARNRRIPVSTAYAAPLTSGIDTCLGSASAGVQTGILGVSLGGTKRDRICETIKLSRELHHMGMREGAVQLLCIDERVRIAMANAGTPCEAVTYAPPPMAYDEPPPPVEYLPPPPRPRRGERG
jgi:hypothetical protein